MEKKVRPRILHSTTTKLNLGCGNIYITVGVDDNNQLFEVFAALGKAGGCASCQNEAVTRLATLCLRYGIPVSEVVKSLTKIKCPNASICDGEHIHSCPDAVSQVLANYLEADSDKEPGLNYGVAKEETQ